MTDAVLIVREQVPALLATTPPSALLTASWSQTGPLIARVPSVSLLLPTPSHYEFGDRHE